MTKTQYTFLTAALLALAPIPNAAAADRFPWLTNLDEARALAASSDKPLLVVFRCEP